MQEWVLRWVWWRKVARDPSPGATGTLEQDVSTSECTVKPLNKGHFWGKYKFSSYVLCGEVVLFSEVQNVIKL